MSQSMDNGMEQSRPTWVRWQIVALLVGYSFMTWFNRVSMSVAYDEQIHEQTGISPEAMGYVYSSFLAAYMIFMTPGGWFIDRFGSRAALIVMGFGSAFFCALTGLAGTGPVLAAGLVFPALLVIRSIMGVFTAPIYPAASRMVYHWIPSTQRAWANGLVQAAAAVGIATAFPLFGALLDWRGWQQAFVITGITTGVLALGWMLHARDWPGAHRSVNQAELDHINQAWTAPLDHELEPHATRWTVLLRHRSLLLLTLSYAAVGYIEYLFFFWMHFYFKDVLHLPTDQSRTYAAILNLSLAAGMIAGGLAADLMHKHHRGWLGRALVPMVAMVAGAGLLVLGVLAENIIEVVVWLSLALAAVGAAEAPVWTLAVELGGRHGGTAAAICNTGGNAGGLIAPILTPLVSGWVSRQFGLSEQAGWQWGIGLGGLIGVVGAVLWIGIRPDAKEDRPRL